MAQTMSTQVMRPFQFSRGNRGRGMSTFNLTEEEYARVSPVLARLNTTADAIRYLYDMGWSNAAICKVISYPTDTMYHKAGDPLLPQHVATTISKYRAEKDGNPNVVPIRNAAIPGNLLIQLPPNEDVVIDVNPERESVEEIAKKEPSEEELEAEAKASEEGEAGEPEEEKKEEEKEDSPEQGEKSKNYKD